MAGSRMPGAILSLSPDQKNAALPIPVVIAQESQAGEPAGTLDAVNVVKNRFFSIQPEILADPLKGETYFLIFVVDSAILESAVVIVRLATFI